MVSVSSELIDFGKIGEIRTACRERPRTLKFEEEAAFSLGRKFSYEGFKQVLSGGAGGGELGFQLVHQGHQLIHFGHDPALFGEGWDREDVY
jgi:hypothetical protein